MTATTAELPPPPKIIPKRDQIPVADTRDLTRLYPAEQNWREDFAAVQKTYPSLARFRNHLGESPETLRECLAAESDLGLKIERLHHYAMLKVAEESSSTEHLQREQELQNLLTKIGELCAFIGPEIQAIPDKTFQRWLQDPVLAEWKISLEKLRRLKAHTLSASEERLLALSSSALNGHGETFGQLTDVDMKFASVLDAHGQAHPLSQSSYSSFLVKRDPELRRRAFHQFYAEFKDHEFTLASTLSNSVRADVFSARARNYPSAIEAALFGDAIPVAVYDNLIASVRANLEPLFRYYHLRQRVLGLAEIHQYDTYVPMVGAMETRHSFDEATELVLAALAPLGSEYVEMLARGLRDRWCDRYESHGKRSGAFSSNSFGNPPFILMNYKPDVFSDIYTLAHEAGHSMHTWHAQRAQKFQDYNYPIFLAEVASTFNEELLTHHLLEQTSDPKMRAYIINRQIDDIRGTVYRQTMFAEFEKIIHAREEAGEPLTLEDFRSVYHALLTDYFGPEFVLDPQLDLECLRIPHFYNAFYVYKYATGMSAAVALSERVLRGEGTHEYLAFLSSGGTEFPLPTLQKAGVDMSSAAPIERTLNLFDRRVAELEELLA